MSRRALLALEDGSLFYGISIGHNGNSVGEVVFNTAMTGYQEILSDPSYAQQMVTLTYPHIGNTGITEEDQESRGVFATGLIIRDLPILASNWRKEISLSQYLEQNKVSGIGEIDTRRLTRILRDKGAQNGCIMVADDDDNIDENEALALARSFPGLKGMDLAKEVTVDEPYEWYEGSWDIKTGYQPVTAEAQFHVVAYDFGIKRNILRMLVDRGCRITVVPAKTTSDDVLAMQPDGIFLSNGPGDPEPCDYAIEAIQTLVQSNTPIFGICLGHQLLGLASGAKSVKMKFGHHGANHPVQNLSDKTVMISSQNHGFAIDEQSLPENMKATHRSLFDGSLQGFQRTDCQAYSFQGHPEASPGPHDVAPVFDQFIEFMSQK
ncbi:MAG: glutamine-hydrolyzing carbamoyl-phosphate synthase small subunit [Gammaproteobacteria bacterium]|nr:glutamine-hydrolyzing carbamoyl-phosphate synthase small subunit [Gammaproteobacteria bacterium]